MLTRTDRLILVNQYLILEKLYPDEARQYGEIRRAIEEGYEKYYDGAFEVLFDELSRTDCEEVTDILDMHQIMRNALALMDDAAGVSQAAVRFHGFDANNEGKQFTFATYLFEIGRYTELDADKELNSHRPMLGTYRDMLSEWQRSANKFKLSLDYVKRILRAGRQTP